MSLSGRIFTYLLLFVALMLILLWLMQIVYIDSFYERIKTDQILATGDELVSHLNKDDLVQTADDLAQENQICISIFHVKTPDLFLLDLEQLCVADVTADCVIHHLIVSDYKYFYDYAMRDGGIYTERFIRTQFTARPAEEGAIDTSTAEPSDVNTLPDSLVYARVAEVEGDTFFILLNSTITPVGAIVSTLRAQLMVSTLVLVVIALLLSLIIAHRTARPIRNITHSARSLAKGDFSHHFEGGSYSEINELAATLNYASAELAKSERLQQDIVANISHDLRTPLTMIGGYAEFMRDFPEEDHSESIDVIIKETQRLTRLINDVLDDSRLSAGVEKLHPEKFNLTVELSELVINYNTLLEKDGYQVQLDADREVSVTADKTRLMQAIGNLINNAITHSGDDKRIIIRQILHKNCLRIEVCDNGPGINPSDQHNIWRRYYHTDAPHRASGGSGLGLSIVKSIFELHGYRYGVDSIPQHGSSFWFEADL